MARSRDALGLLGLLLLPAAFFLSNTGIRPLYAWLDGALSGLVRPLQSATVACVDATQNAVRHYLALVAVSQENDALRAQVERMAVQVHHLQELGHENERLRHLLAADAALAEIPGAPHSLSARIIAAAPSPLFRSVRLDRGKKDGLALGAAVLSPQGVVGRVVSLAAATADVLLLTDAGSSADVVVQRSRARVRVRGRGGNDALLLDAQYLERTADVEPGDLLLTSGLGVTFPKGLLVGRVQAVERRAYGLYQAAQIKPAVDFARLEEVLVLLPPQG